MVSIYSYDDPVEYFNDYLKQLKNSDSSFSLNNFAKMAGLKSAAPLIDILKRKKKINSKLANVICSSVNIDVTEKMYFQTLVKKKSAREEHESIIYDLILSELRPINSTKNAVLRTNKFNIFSHWVYMAIFAMNDLPDFQLTASSIKEKLREEVDIEIIEEALLKLFEHKILVKNEDGAIESKFFRVTTESNKKCLDAQKYFEATCDLAKDAYEVPLEKREFNSFSFTLAEEDIPIAKEIIRKCRSSLANLSERRTAKNVYHANLMLFPLTK